MKIVLAAIGFCLLFAPGAYAWDEHHCFWVGHIQCRPGWTWQERREWREEEWRERMRHREHERYEHEVR